MIDKNSRGRDSVTLDTGNQTFARIRKRGGNMEAKNLGKTSTGIQANVAGLLSYVLGWLTGLIFFLIEKENKFVRFHAAQSLVVFGALTVLQIAIGIFAGYIIMMQHFSG